VGAAGTRQEALVADTNRSTVELLRSLLLTRQIYTVGAYDTEALWRILHGSTPHLLFVNHAPPALDAHKFTRELRRSDLDARKAPVIMLATDPTPSQVIATRDAGVHELLRKPFTLADLLLRVDAVTRKPRGWIEGVDYVGPDRRRFNSALLAGQRRRRIDREAKSPEHVRIGQALRIMKVAVDAIDRDPRQALRSLRAQANELECAAVALADYDLARAARTLASWLNGAVQRGRFSSGHIKTDLGGVFAASAPKQAYGPEQVWWGG
jgi:DNA-binding response OmpR family regulator